MYYKVLIVDDEEIVCRGLSTFINWKEYGYEVSGTASSVAQALVFLENNDIDVVISDIRMPVQDGFALLEIMEQEYPDIKPIVLSAFGEFSYAQQAMRLGAVDFLTKPVVFLDMQRLLSRLYQTLEAERKESSKKQEYYEFKLNTILNDLSKGYLNYADCMESLNFIQSSENFYLLRFQVNGTTPYDRLKNIKKIVIQMAEELAGSTCQLCTYNNELDEVACLLWTDTNEEMIQFAEAMISHIEQKHISISIGISDMQKGYDTIKIAYRQAGMALQYKMIKHNSNVILFSQLDPIIFTADNENDAFDTGILTFLNDPQQRYKVIPYLYGKLEEIGDTVYKGKLDAFCIQTLLTLSNHIMECSEQEADFIKELYELIRKILLSETTKEVINFTIAYVEKLIIILDKLDVSEFSYGIINNIKLYIFEHYAEVITLNKLSELFYVHPIYLSRLFKEKTGVNFIDYVTEVRINKSKEFLRDNQYKIYDISRMVGYESSCYFSKLFKSTVGMTPKSYRDSI